MSGLGLAAEGSAGSLSACIPFSPVLNHSVHSTSTRDDLIQYYSLAGLPTSLIHRFLCEVHNIHVSERHIRRIRKRLGVCSTSSTEASIPTICAAIRVSAIAQ